MFSVAVSSITLLVRKLPKVSKARPVRCCAPRPQKRTNLLLASGVKLKYNIFEISDDMYQLKG